MLDSGYTNHLPDHLFTYDAHLYCDKFSGTNTEKHMKTPSSPGGTAGEALYSLGSHNPVTIYIILTQPYSFLIGFVEGQ